MKQWIKIFLLMLSLNAQAGSLTVRELYDVQSRVPQAIIPFQVKEVGQTQPVSISSVQVKSAGGVDCRAMVDPFRHSVFLLKCLDQADVQLNLLVSTSAGLVGVDYGPVRVQAPSGYVIVPPPPPGEIERGRQYYQTFCVGCHTSAASMAQRTVAQINSAIQTRPAMQSLRLTSEQVSAIAAYLGSL